MQVQIAKLHYITKYFDYMNINMYSINKNSDFGNGLFSLLEAVPLKCGKQKLDMWGESSVWNINQC